MYIYLNVCKQVTNVRLWLIYKKYLKLFKCVKKSSGSFKNFMKKMFTNHVNLIYI